MSDNLAKLIKEDSCQLDTNLRQLMHDKRITEAELARFTNIPQSTIHKILAGKTEDPRMTTLQTLAHFFNLTIDELISGYKKLEPMGQAVPIITLQDCLTKDFTKKLNANNWTKWITIDHMASSNYPYGIVTSTSMEPRFPRGTILIIDPDASPKDGDLTIVYYPNSQEATIRELLIDGPNKFLLPFNANLSRDIFIAEIKILGVVIQSRFVYKN